MAISPALKEIAPSLGVGEIRLNLGGRTHKIPGFLTVDKFGGKEVDYDCDISQLPFAIGTVSEIYSSHCLEHFPHVKTLDVLKEWRRVLKRGGKLYISVPDIDACVVLINKFGFNEYIRNLMYGDQGYDLAYHYTIFNFSALARLCCDAGFDDVRRIDQMPYGLCDCSTNIDSYTRKPISVNVEAIA